MSKKFDFFAEISKPDSMKKLFPMNKIGAPIKGADPKCECCHGRGWAVFSRFDGSKRDGDLAVQRCDECNVFVYDSDAAAEANKAGVLCRTTAPCWLPLYEWHVDIGNSNKGAIGLCARVKAQLKFQALQIIQDTLPEELEIKRDVADGEDEIGYVNVYFNTDAIKLSDLGDPEEVEDEDEEAEKEAEDEEAK